MRCTLCMDCVGDSVPSQQWPLIRSNSFVPGSYKLAGEYLKVCREDRDALYATNGIESSAKMLHGPRLQSYLPLVRRADIFVHYMGEHRSTRDVLYPFVFPSFPQMILSMKGGGGTGWEVDDLLKSCTNTTRLYGVCWRVWKVQPQRNLQHQEQQQKASLAVNKSLSLSLSTRAVPLSCTTMPSPSDAYIH